MRERSNLIVMESLRESLETLRLNPSKESREQQKVLAAAVTSLEYGTPDLGLHRRDEIEAKDMKRHPMAGDEKILKTQEK